MKLKRLLDDFIRLHRTAISSFDHHIIILRESHNGF